MHEKLICGLLTAFVTNVALVSSCVVFGDQEVLCGIKWTYTINGGEAVVTGWDRADSSADLGKVSIPSVLGRCPVTGVGGGNSIGATLSESVIMPMGIKNIGAYAFQYCYKLKSVTMHEGVTNIGSYAFRDCKLLSCVNIPTTVTRIGSSAFQNCEALGNGVVIVDGCVLTVNGIASRHVDLPEGTRLIGDYVFYNSKGSLSIESFHLPKSMKLIGAGAFANGTLGLFKIPEGVEEIGEQAFWRSDLGPSLVIPSSVKKIEASAFASCYKLKSVTMLEGVESLGTGAFDSSGLTSIVFPSSIREIGYHVFYSREAFLKRIVYVSASSKERICEMLADAGVVPEKTAYQVVCMTELPSATTGTRILVKEDWKDKFPTFETRFGKDFQTALLSKSGKRDIFGNEMYVWQDYVAGTDPTKENDKFTASVNIVDGKIIISHLPVLEDEQTDIRQYTTWGKKSLADKDWIEVPAGNEAVYNFFRVTVEMR